MVVFPLAGKRLLHAGKENKMASDGEFSEFEIAAHDGARFVVRHHANASETRLYITHGNGFAIDGYRVFWDPLLGSYDIVLFDMRNHGRNPPTGADGHHYKRMAADLAEIHAGVEARLGAKRGIGVFHSMSARAAMKGAADNGTPFEALVLFDPPSVPPPDHAVYDAMRGFELKLVNWAAERRQVFASPGELEQIYAESRGSARWQPQAHADMARAVLRADPAGGFRLVCQRELEASIYLAALTLDLWPDAASLGVPSKLIGADPNGGGPPTGLANQALGREGGYDYGFVEGTGHLLQIEKPEACREAMIAFLETL